MKGIPVTMKHTPKSAGIGDIADQIQLKAENYEGLYTRRT